MHGSVLVTTAPEGLQPLGAAAQRSWELLTGVLRDRLGEDHAALLAEPVPSEHGDRIDWHAPVEGTGLPLSALEPGDRQALRARLDALVADIRAEADRLAQSADAADRRLAEALGNALEIPGEEMIFAIRTPEGGLRPVLVHWAWIRSEARAVRGVLTGRVPHPAPAPGIGAGGGGSRAWPWRWLLAAGWALVALMIGAILYLMIAPCGLNPAGPDLCPGEGAALAAAWSEEAAIRDEIGALEREIALTARVCRPVVPLSPALPPVPAPTPAPAPTKPAPEPPVSRPPAPSTDSPITR